MSSEIICVYQDCIMCGDRGKKLKKLIFDKGLNVRKVSFASEEGRSLIHQALFVHKIGTMPFYTDGNKFSTNLNDFVPNCDVKPQKVRKATAKTKKKTTKKVKEVDNGTD